MVVAIIPSRYASSRLPGKPLLDLGGKSLIRRVHDAVSSCPSIDRVIVATDDERIHDHVAGFGGEVAMTATEHRSGTDRVAEVAVDLPPGAIVVNVQGDEPFITSDQLTAAIAPFADKSVQITTLATTIQDESLLFSPAAVKVVTDSDGNALYFSRQAIPYLRDVPLGRWIDEGAHLHHLGVYAFRNHSLQQLTALPVPALERREMLEQLRWLHAGFRIRVARCKGSGFGIDTVADLERARLRYGVK